MRADDCDEVLARTWARVSEASNHRVAATLLSVNPMESER
jgi:hypothetical protein